MHKLETLATTLLLGGRRQSHTTDGVARNHSRGSDWLLLMPVILPCSGLMGHVHAGSRTPMLSGRGAVPSAGMPSWFVTALNTVNRLERGTGETLLWLPCMVLLSNRITSLASPSAYVMPLFST